MFSVNILAIEATVVVRVDQQDQLMSQMDISGLLNSWLLSTPYIIYNHKKECEKISI